MLLRTTTLRYRLAVCAASIALVAGLTAAPAAAGSKKDKYWLQQGGQPTGQYKPGHRKQDRRYAPEVSTSRAGPPAWQPQHDDRREHRRRDARGAQPQPPRFAERDRRHGRHYAPPPPPPWWNRADGRQHRHGDHDYRHNHKPHRKYVEQHVYRYYYYRTSPRHYYYYSYDYPPPAAYPVYYLVPYHLHTDPGYHNHGEQATYCSDGYADGGVYRGGAYTRGASHQAGATIIGGILGAAAGSQVGGGKGQLVAVGVGTLIGALIGNDIGRSLDRQDQAYATGSFGHAMETAPTCTTVRWDNRQSGNYGSVTPVNTYEPEPGRYCREFQQQVVIGGKLQDAYGTACRQPDGSWEIVAEQP